MRDTNQAEKTIVIAMLLDARDGSLSAFRVVVDEFGLGPSHFRDRGLQVIYRAALDAYSAAIPAGDTPSLSDVLVRLEGAGVNEGTLGRIRDALPLSSRGDVRTAARMVTGRALSELADEAIKDFKKRTRNPLGVQSAVAGLAEFLLSAAERGGAQESRPDVIMGEFWGKGYNRPVSTGLTALDRAVSGDNMAGGFERDTLWVLGAPSGHGKSALTCHLAVEQAKQNRGVVIHSFEMSREALILRMLCNMACVPMSSALNPGAAPLEERAQIDAAVKKMGDLVRVYDRHATMDEIGLRIRRHRVEFGSEHVLHVLDHFGHVDDGTDWRDSQKAIYNLKRLAGDNHVCLAVFSQVDERTRTELQDKNRTIRGEFYGSRAVKQAADVAGFIVRHNGINEGGDGYDESMRNVTCMQITKVRKTGRQAYFGIRYRPEWFTYERGELWYED